MPGWPTRKGLFELQRVGTAWRIARTSLLGEPVTMVLPPDAQGRRLAALNLGHFGVHVHRCDDQGATWREVGTPAFPPQPPEDEGLACKLVLIWSLQAQGNPVWAGTIPGGLFRSADGWAAPPAACGPAVTRATVGRRCR